MSHFQKKNKGAKIPKLGQDDIDSTEYYFENGLRKVYPYFFPFSTFVKGRWIGRTIRDVFVTEFKGVTTFEEDLENDLVKVNGKPVRGDWVLKTQQFVEHMTHRHENPVTAVPIDIIADTPDLLVINKPSSIPVHPCGRYRFNSLTMLLWKEYGYRNLRTLYRLDRLTSGVLLLPKTTAMSVKLEKQLAAKKFNKEYICRVEGEFPQRTIECKEPLGVISIRMAVSGVRPDGKESHTTFTRLSYNGRSSVVKCIPHTGRTHQIRVHLQYLGYPILNDPVYNSLAFGPQKGKGGKIDKSVTELEQVLSRMHNSSEWIIGKNEEYYQKFGSNKSTENVTIGTQEPGSNIAMETCETNRNTCETISGTSGSDTRNVHTDDVVSKVGSEVDTSVNEAEKVAQNDTDQISNHKELTDNSVSNDGTENSKWDKCDSISCGNTDNKQSEENQTEHSTKPKVHIDQYKSTEESDLVGTTSDNVVQNSDVEMKESAHQTESDKSKEINKNSVDKETDILEEMKESTNSAETDKEDSTNESNNSKLADVSDKLNESANTKETDKSGDVKQGDMVITRTDAVKEAGGWEKYVAKNGFDRSKYVLERTCEMCRNSYKEPQPNELILFLHAVRYKGPGWEYSTPLPDWAHEDWNLEDQYIVDYDS